MNGTLPNPNSDIHPWMPSSLHGFDANSGRFDLHASPLGSYCKAAHISIHDREKAYEQMKIAGLNHGN